MELGTLVRASITPERSRYFRNSSFLDSPDIISSHNAQDPAAACLLLPSSVQPELPQGALLQRSFENLWHGLASVNRQKKNERARLRLLV
jgi:hypothetical protein